MTLMTANRRRVVFLTGLASMVGLLLADPVRADEVRPSQLPSGGDEFRAVMLDWSGEPPPSHIIENLQLPVRLTRYSSLFGLRRDPMRSAIRKHWGLDIPELFGTPVRAAADGIVIFAGRAGGYGNLVKIDHGGGRETRYAHLSAITIDTGDDVRQGDEIGRVGNTGHSTGPHLHFELREDGRAVDPLGYLDAPFASTEVMPVISAIVVLPQYSGAENMLPSPILNDPGVVLQLCNVKARRSFCPSG